MSKSKAIGIYIGGTRTKSGGIICVFKQGGTNSERRVAFAFEDYWTWDVRRLMIAPASVFMYTKNNADGKYGSAVSANYDTLTSKIFNDIYPCETKTFNIIIGIKDKDKFTNVQQQGDDVLTDAEMNNPSEGLYTSQWKNKLPDFSNEPDEVLKREMLWHAHVLEASAKYSSYSKETFIPKEAFIYLN